MEENLFKDKSLILKFIILSVIGVFMFFVPIEIKNTNSIPIAHILNYLIENFYNILKYLATIIIIIGAIKPIINKTFNENPTALIFNIGKIIGAIFTILLVTNMAPEAISRDDTGPFMFNNLVMRVMLLIPICAIFLTFLLDYGFVDFIGEFLKPIMRVVFKSPGETSVVLLASFLGSPSVGIVMANDMYLEGRYNLREATLSVTSFSIATVSFMSIIVETADLMDYWSLYLLVSIISALIVSAITARIYPLSKISETYKKDMGNEKISQNGNIFERALNNALNTAKNSGKILPRISKKLKNSVRMLFEVLPNFMSIGIIALVLVNYTKIFDYIGMIFYPLTSLLRIPEPMLAAKASILGLAEIFLPVSLSVGAPFKTRFILSTLAVTQMLMFSDNITTIMASDIEVSIKDILIIWVERTVIGFIVVSLIAHILF